VLHVQVIDDPVAAAVALEPVRSRLLAELAQPASAAPLGRPDRARARRQRRLLRRVPGGCTLQIYVLR